jgi:O-antigen/teichoic acid export membrane protein
MEINSVLKKIKGKKTTILFDQALFSLFNFGSIIALSKLADLTVFSDFIVFQSNVFFLFIFCTFFLSSPILVLYPKKWRKHEKEYLRALLSTNMLLNLVIGLILFFLLKQQGLYISFVFVVGIPVLMITFDIFKKFMFSSNRISLYHTWISSLLLNIVFFFSIFYFKSSLTFTTILSIYLFAYGIATFYLMLIFLAKNILSLQFFIPNLKKNIHFVAVINHHFRYSKWIMLGGIAYWGYAQGLYIYANELNTSALGIGKIKTVQNLLGIVSIFIITVENFYTPMFSNFIRLHPTKNVGVMVRKVYRENYIKALGVLLIVLIFSIVFYEILYIEKYGDALVIILIYCVCQSLMLFLRPITMALKALEITRPFFVGHLWATLTMFLVGSMLIKKYDYIGMAISFAAAIVVFSIIIIGYYKKYNTVNVIDS